MNSPEQTPGASKAPSKAQSIDEERPSGPMRRDSLASLSVAREPRGWVEPEEPTWPSGWKPYACLFGGFLLMFNSWGIVNAYGSYASYYMQHLLPGLRQPGFKTTLVTKASKFTSAHICQIHHTCI